MTIDSTLPLASAWGNQAMTQLVPLAKELDKNKVTPGVLGFIVFALLGGAVWLLMKNMSKQFTKIDFQERTAGEGETVPAARKAAGSGTASGTASGTGGTTGTGGADRPASSTGD
ncbi:hypothetical protein DMH02_018960 [Streptomyces sp. WAC 00631]|uniref:hypothetical protein n=1 Tax=unclassified Streptomyces TaxID=2593676 RepID=UPI000F780BD5|nr:MULTISPECIES: hypothetical protein [unclassified Streptomyces]MCC5035237.1 hypothetical protein [Streptomyces sp. WAC 00631]MCC9739703.1 hypothetical protein [Streptomyces sp. MNU89]